MQTPPLLHGQSHPALKPQKTMNTQVTTRNTRVFMALLFAISLSTIAFLSFISNAVLFHHPHHSIVASPETVRTEANAQPAQPDGAAKEVQHNQKVAENSALPSTSLPVQKGDAVLRFPWIVKGLTWAGGTGEIIVSCSIRPPRDTFVADLFSALIDVTSGTEGGACEFCRGSGKWRGFTADPLYDPACPECGGSGASPSSQSGENGRRGTAGGKDRGSGVLLRVNPWTRKVTKIVKLEVEPGRIISTCECPVIVVECASGNLWFNKSTMEPAVRDELSDRSVSDQLYSPERYISHLVDVTVGRNGVPTPDVSFEFTVNDSFYPLPSPPLMTRMFRQWRGDHGHRDDDRQCVDRDKRRFAVVNSPRGNAAMWSAAKTKKPAGPVADERTVVEWMAGFAEPHSPCFDESGQHIAVADGFAVRVWRTDELTMGRTALLGEEKARRLALAYGASGQRSIANIVAVGAELPALAEELCATSDASIDIVMSAIMYCLALRDVGERDADAPLQRALHLWESRSFVSFSDAETDKKMFSRYHKATREYYNQSSVYLGQRDINPWIGPAAGLGLMYLLKGSEAFVVQKSLPSIVMTDNPITFSEERIVESREWILSTSTTVDGEGRNESLSLPFLRRGTLPQADGVLVLHSVNSKSLVCGSTPFVLVCRNTPGNLVEGLKGIDIGTHLLIADESHLLFLQSAFSNRDIVIDVYGFSGRSFTDDSANVQR